jgi:hypothetical protein
MREFSQVEKERIDLLIQNSVEVSLLSPQVSEFEKSQIIVSSALLEYLRKNEIYDFEKEESKTNDYDNAAYIKGYSLVNLSWYILSTSHLPNRYGIWFKQLQVYAKPNDILGVIALDRRIYILNITEIDIKSFVADAFSNPINEIVRAARNEKDNTSIELLGKLRAIADQGPIAADLMADTAVGRMLEKLLGLKINSLKKPDYKGIELKAFRENRENRFTLFAQVPNWEFCNLKSSAEILNRFGYKRGLDHKLYCTLSTSVRNSQGLMLRVDKEKHWLVENSKDPECEDIAVWALQSLHKNLINKHYETFWVGFKSQIKDEKEYLTLSKIIHTQRPFPGQFNALIEQGIITLDHLIKKVASGKVVEKGPLFKIERDSLRLLFSQCKVYL